MPATRTCSVTTWNGKNLWIKSRLMSLFFSDYRAQPELDIMSASGLDDATDISEMSVAARRAAEREMAERDNLVFDEGQVSVKCF